MARRRATATGAPKAAHRDRCLVTHPGADSSVALPRSFRHRHCPPALAAGAEVNRILRNREVLRIERDHRHDPVRAVLGTLARLWTARPGWSGRWRWLAVERRTRQRLPTDSTNLEIGSTAGGACGAGSAAPPRRSRRTSVRSARRETTLPAASIRSHRARIAASSAGSGCERRMSRSCSADTVSPVRRARLRVEKIWAAAPGFSSPAALRSLPTGRGGWLHLALDCNRPCICVRPACRSVSGSSYPGSPASVATPPR